MLLLPSLAAALGVVLAWRARGDGPSRWIQLLAPPVATVGFLALASAWLGVPWNHWNGARLAPALGLLHGQPLYCSPEAGSIQTTIYPPAGYLMFLPAGLAGTPTGALLAAATLNIAYLLAPAAACFRLASRGSAASVPLTVLATAALALFGLRAAPLDYDLRMIHADGPALLFAVTSCILAAGPHTRPHAGPAPARPIGRWMPWVAALAACLAVWSKQTFVGCVLALPLYVAWSRGRRAGWRCAGRLIATSLLTTGVMLLLVHPAHLLYHTWSIPAAFHFKTGGVGRALGAFLGEGWPTLTGLALVLASRRSTRARTARSTRTMGAELGRLLAWVGAVLTPLSLLGEAKFGGGPNSYHNLYFFQVATLCFLLDGTRHAEPGNGRQARRLASSAALLVGALVLAATALVSLRDTSLRDALRRLPGTPQEFAFRFTRRHPGKAWFPSVPLANVLAEGRLDPFDTAVGNWQVAGIDVTRERLLASVPTSVSLVAYPRAMRNRMKYVARALSADPPAVTPVREAELPRWYVLRLRDPGASR